MKDITWHNVTHYLPLWALPIWKRFFCRRGWHLFDELWGPCSHGAEAECKGIGCIGYKHVLYCDACDLEVELSDAARLSQDQQRDLSNLLTVYLIDGFLYHGWEVTLRMDKAGEFKGRIMKGSHQAYDNYYSLEGLIGSLAGKAFNPKDQQSLPASEDEETER